MKRLTLSLFVLTSILFAISVQAQVGPEQARNYQINEAHTGAINVSGVLPPLKQKWSRNFGQDMSYPLVADGKVYVTVRYLSVFGTELYALNAADGATLWSYPLGGSASWSASCYENGRVFALNNSGLLRAFDGDTGNVIWSRQLSGTNFTSAPTVFQGVIYIGGSASGTAHAVSAETGNVLWSRTVGAGSTTAAVTTDGVYLSYSCIDFSRLNPADGSLIWRGYGACGSGTGRAPAIYNGRAYVRTPSYSLDQRYYIPEGGYAGDFISKSAPAFSGNTGFFLNGNRFGGPTQTYAGTFNISAGGVHIVNYWSVDLAGNTEAQKSLTVRVDSAAPTTQITTGGIGANGWYRGPVQVGVTATDPEAGVTSPCTASMVDQPWSMARLLQSAVEVNTRCSTGVMTSSTTPKRRTAPRSE